MAGIELITVKQLVTFKKQQISNTAIEDLSRGLKMEN